MHITYSTNPHLPRLRAKAVEMLRSGKSLRQVSRHFGFNASTISRWNKRVPKTGAWLIPTKSSRPHHHSKELSPNITNRIVELRRALKGRCAEVIHGHMIRENIRVSLSSVKRTLDRRGMTKKKSPWKKLHYSIKRPEALKPGDLVEVDTIHLMKDEHSRMYIYTLLDVHSRWAYAKAFDKLSNPNSIKFVREARGLAPFKFLCIQSDHGSEFSKRFSKLIKLTHRHARIRKPNDNGHLERFNRTIQDELVSHLTTNVRIINKQLPEYLNYYNTRRLHLGLNLKTPAEVLQRYWLENAGGAELIRWKLRKDTSSRPNYARMLHRVAEAKQRLHFVAPSGAKKWWSWGAVNSRPEIFQSHIYKFRSLKDRVLPLIVL